MRNERLAAAIRDAGMSVEDMASDIPIHPKTVKQWINGSRLPHEANRQRASAVLRQPEGYLFPEVMDAARSASAMASEFVQIHPSRASIHGPFLGERIDSATTKIDLMAYGGSFLYDTVPHFAQRVQARARAGVAVRLLLGDPDSEAVRLRGQQEGLEQLVINRCRHAWHQVGPLVDSPGITAARHGETLYNSIFRFDDLMFVNAHMFGSPAADNPVIELQRLEGGVMFDRYVRSFDATWSAAKPVFQADIPGLSR